MAETGVKIVVVEDDPQIRTLVHAILTGEGYDVTTVGEPTRAVDVVREIAPALVLCDIAMPDLDGYGVLRALQSDPTTARFPVVFLTAHREFSERVRAFRYGVVDYLTKPFTKSILVGKVKRVLEQVAQREPAPAVVRMEEQHLGEALDEVQREARTGVLTVDAGGGPSRVLLRAGKVLGGTPPPPVMGTATFEALDPLKEDIVEHDPTTLPGSADALPSFEALPEMVRDVLLVDDNKAFRAFMSALLSRLGFTPHQAEDGEEGLRVALERRPWLIVTDVRMQGMDGFEFCRRVREHSLLRQTPLLFLSGWDDYKARYQGLELGANDFLSKGVPLRELLIRIQILMRRYTDVQGRTRADSGMEGDVAVIGVPGVLQMCHLGRLTGILTVVDGARTLGVGFRGGEILAADPPRTGGQDALFDLVAWDRGRFHFVPGDPGGDLHPDSFDHVLLEACRLLDEKLR